MADETKPFFGNPKVARQAAKGRKNQAKTYEDTWLDAFIKGFFGEEEATGSVLEEGREKKVQANSVGQLGGIATDVLPNLKALGLAGLGLAGAIRVKGARDLRTTHAFPAHAGGDIAKAGYLDAPSIGIVSREPNDYAKSNPNFIWRAGALDSDKQVGTLINRDGYFENPTGRIGASGFSQKSIQEQIARALAKTHNEYGVRDLRLGQMMPNPGQSLAIASSPAFSSFADFERSPFGAALLRKPRDSRDPSWTGLNNELRQWASANSSVMTPKEFTKNLIRRRNFNGPEGVRVREEELWQKAKGLPSAMAEFKLLQKLDLNPADAFIHVPTEYGFTASMAEGLAPLRDAGFQIRGSHNFVTPDMVAEAPKGWINEVYKRLPNAASPDGRLLLPPKLTGDEISNLFMNKDDFRLWEDFITGGKAGGSPPLKPPVLDPDVLAKQAIEGMEKQTKPGTFQHLEDWMSKNVPDDVPSGVDTPLNPELAEMFGLDELVPDFLKPTAGKMKGDLESLPDYLTPWMTKASANFKGGDFEKHLKDLYMDGSIPGDMAHDLLDWYLKGKDKILNVAAAPSVSSFTPDFSKWSPEFNDLMAIAKKEGKSPEQVLEDLWNHPDAAIDKAMFDDLKKEVDKFLGPQLGGPSPMPDLLDPAFDSKLSKFTGPGPDGIDFKLTSPSAQQAYQMLWGQADEYLDVVDQVLKKNPGLNPDTVVKDAAELYQSGFHHSVKNWHQALENNLTHFSPSASVVKKLEGAFAPPKLTGISKDTLDLVLEKPTAELAKKQLDALHSGGYLTQEQFQEGINAIYDHLDAGGFAKGTGSF